MVASDILSQPFPKPLNGIQVGAVAGKREKSKIEGVRLCLRNQGSMPGCAIPDDRDRALRIAQPLGHSFQKGDRVFRVAVAFVPNEALSIGKVVGAILGRVCKVSSDA